MMGLMSGIIAARVVNSTSLSVNNLNSNSSIQNVSLTQSHTLAVNNLNSGATIQSPSLTQVHGLTVGNLNSGSSLQSPSLIQNFSLSVANLNSSVNLQSATVQFVVDSGFKYSLGLITSSLICDLGTIPAAFCSYDPITELVDNLYQRYRIYDSGTATALDYIIDCIIGNYVICIGGLSGTNGTNVIISPYLMNDSVNIQADWIDDNTLVVGTDVIQIAATGKIRTVIPLSENKFVICCGLISSSDVYTIYFVNFTNQNTFTVDEIDIDVNDYDEIDHLQFSTSIPNFAVNYETKILAVSLYFASVGSVCFGINFDTYEIQESVLYNIPFSANGTIHPLTYFDGNINENILQLILTTDALGSVYDLSMRNTRFSSANNSGVNRVIGTYTNRSITYASEKYLTVYNSESTETKNMQDLSIDYIEGLSGFSPVTSMASGHPRILLIF